jgi:hypothetical protein
MTFSIISPTSIAKLFGNWLVGVSKKDKVQIRVGACALLWAIWNIRNDYIFNNAKSTFVYAGYLNGYTLDSYVVLPITNGEAREFGY